MAAIPTMEVWINGDRAVINRTDYNPKIHSTTPPTDSTTPPKKGS